MKQKQIPTFSEIMLTMEGVLGVFSTILHSKWQKKLTFSLLFSFTFNLGAPSALALFEIEKAQALSPINPVISSLVNSVFGVGGEVLEKFDTLDSAISYKDSASESIEYQLTAILVDEDLANSNSQYDGLISEHNPQVPAVPNQEYRRLKANTIMDRIERYAGDIQGINPVKNPTAYQKTIIIKVKADEATPEIRAALEKLYREGDGASGEKNKLVGLVIIGDIPLPVVNKNGNRFISMMPYTDFDDPYYIFDEASEDFVINDLSTRLQPEIWHGLIVPPRDGEEGREMLAEYLDKNHLFKIGEPEYSNFEKKLFYSDLNKEFDLVTEEGLPAYDQYLKYWEDISYNRFNKTWAAKLSEESSFNKPEGDGVDNDGDGAVDEDPSNGYDDDGDAEAGSPLFGLINSVDDDGDGVVDNDEEGVWGFCSPIAPTGKTVLENCQEAGKPYKTNDYYNVKAGSKYFVADGVNNNAAADLMIDEGIDEDEGDAFLNIDNDRDGRIDEDTSADNDLDGDMKIDEDGFGDMNGDGCPGQCGLDDDNDSVDGDMDMYPLGYERDYGSLGLSLGGLKKLMQAAKNGDIKSAFAGQFTPTNAKSIFNMPIIRFSPPIGPAFGIPRMWPLPANKSEWIDEGSVNDDDEDGQVDEDGTADNDNDQDGFRDEDPGDAMGLSQSQDAEETMSGLPDIQTRNIIMNYFKQYNQLLDNFYVDINDWVDYTGRYDSKYTGEFGDRLTDLVTLPFLISLKDEFTRIYLKAVNDAIEARIDNYVEKLQYDVRLIKGATISGYVILPDNNGVFPPGSKIRLKTANFINFGYNNTNFSSLLEDWLKMIDALKKAFPNNSIDQEVTDFLKLIDGPVNDYTQVNINGKPIEDITNIAECSLFRGSEGDENSQMIIASTVFDPTTNLNTEAPPTMPESWQSLSDDTLLGTDNNDYEGKFWWWSHSDDSPFVKWQKKQRLLNKAYAGCFAENSNEPTRCFPTLATRYIFSLGGSKKVSGVPESAINHQACFDLKEKKGYDAFALNAALYLQKLSKAQFEEDKVALDSEKPLPGEAYRAPKDIVLLDFADNAPVYFEIDPSNTAPIPPAVLTAAENDQNLQQFQLSLEEILRYFGGGNRVDDNQDGTIDEAAEAQLQYFPMDANGQPSWTMVGDMLLKRDRVAEGAAEYLDKPLLFSNSIIPGTKEVILRINAIETSNEVSSLVYHKSPDVDEVEAQTYELARDSKGNFIENVTRTSLEKRSVGKYLEATKTAPDGTEVKNETRNAESIPIDSPRYVSFMDSNGDYQKIIYPNAYDAESLMELHAQLKDLESKLALIQPNPKYAGNDPINIDGYLTSVLDNNIRDDNLTQYFKDIETASAAKVGDALGWKKMDLDEKHNYVISRYFGSGMPSFTSPETSDNGYEVLYLNASGDAKALTSKFNKDIPAPKTETRAATVNCEDPANAYMFACSDGQSATAADEGGLASVESKSSLTPVFITEWFAAMEEWADDTEHLLTEGDSVESCPAGSFTDYAGDGEVSASEIPIVDVPIDLSGGLGGSNNTTRLKLSYATGGKDILKTGTSDQTKVVVEALKNNGSSNTSDNTTMVTLAVESDNAFPTAQIMGEEEMQLAAGKAVYVISAGDYSGNSLLEAYITDRTGVKSNSLQLKTSNEIIKLVSFRRYTTYKFKEGGEAGYLILDGNGNTVAEVSPETGYINILNDDYQLSVLPADGQKPLRIAVVEKANEAPVALEYFVADSSKDITIHPANFSFEEEYSTLQGVQVKDLNAADNLALQQMPNGQGMEGSYLVTDGAGQKVALIDKRGNIYTDLQLTVKEGEADSPVIFEIHDASGVAAVEVFVGVNFDLIETLSWESVSNLLTAIFNNWFEWPQSAHAQDSAEPASVVSEPNNSARGEKPEDTQFVNPDTDQDGLNDLEELVIGTFVDKADSNENGKNDLEDLLSGVNPLQANKPLFSDLGPASKGFEDVVKLLRRGILRLEPNGKFRPDDKITREEFILLDLGGICVICDRFSEEVKARVMSLYVKAPFPDTNIGEEYKYCVAEGKNRGIVSGYKAYENAGYYVPKANISRAEATKVILETARQQLDSFPQFVVNENLNGKPWYYSYVLTAQKEGFYPEGYFVELDDYSNDKFKAWFDNEIIMGSQGLPGDTLNSRFMIWISQPISRLEFAVMVSRFADKYNCLDNDGDGDGVPDNLEKYVYGTNAADADTDNGGVKDGAEILRGSDPLDAKDDFPAPPEPPANEDPDGDGLLTGRENEIGTDYLDPDTDDGGINDGLEVLLGLDPLDGSDDQGAGSEGVAGEGVYLAGLEIAPKVIYELPAEGDVDQEQILTEETDRIPADGESEIFVRATIYDEDGDVKETDNSSIINFYFAETEAYKNAKLEPANVKVTNGVAETMLASKYKSGLPTVKARILTQNISTQERPIEVYSLDPAKAEVSSVSNVLASTGKSATTIKANLYDKNGNLANSGSYQVTFNLKNKDQDDLSAYLDPQIDEDKETKGIQITSVTGEYELRLISGTVPENLEVSLEYQDPLDVLETNYNNATADLLNLGVLLFKPATVSASATVQTRDDMAIIVSSDKNELEASGQDKTNIHVSIEDLAGNNISGFNDEVQITLQNTSTASLINDEKEVASIQKNLINGVATFDIQGTRKAGPIVLSVSVTGLNAVNYTLENVAYKPYQIVLESQDNEIKADPAENHLLTAKVYDLYGNQVKKDNSTAILFNIEPESLRFGEITSPAAVTAQNGEAIITYRSETLTGPIRFRASSPGLVDGTTEIYSVNKLTGPDLKEIKPWFLYANLLGASFGDVTEEDYFGGWFVFSGKVQSAATMIAEPAPKTRLFEVSPSGKVNLIDANHKVRVSTSGDEDSYFRQIVQNQFSGKDLAEVIVIPKPQSKTLLVDSIDQADLQSETINVISLINDNPNYTFDNDGSKVEILKKNVSLGSIDKDLNILINNPTLQVVNSTANDGKNLEVFIQESGSEIAQIIVSLNINQDVKWLNDNQAASGPGVYLRALNNEAEREWITSFSGNSSHGVKGFYYTDTSTALDKSMAPGGNFSSLESAGDDDGIGLRGENKNVLLFTAGNTVGEANLPYASDGGVVLGDPTVRLNNKVKPNGDRLFTDSGYTQDIGKMVLAGEDNVVELNQIDYDNDGDKDVFVAYENGDLRLLENVNQGKSFRESGVYLEFPNGILSQAVADINADGWDDLVVASENGCKVDEVCVDAYLNNHGNFVRQNLDLEGYNNVIKVTSLRIADLNNDSFSDLVVADNSGSIKVFYSHKGELNRKGYEVGNLGVKINSADNLKNEVMIYYSGMGGNEPGQADDKYFEEIKIRGSDASKDRLVSFKSLARDGILGISSEKRAKDLTPPNTVVSEGDLIEYTIRVVNPTTANLNNLLLSDVVSGSTTLDPESIECIDCDGALATVETGLSLRPVVVAGLSLPAKSSRTIRYRVTVNSVPRIKLAVGNNLSDEYPVKDNFADIMATPEGNTSGQIVYYYSKEKNNTTGVMSYGEYVTAAPDMSTKSGYVPPTDKNGQTVGLDLNMFEEKNANGVPVAVQHFLDYGTFPGMGASDLGNSGGTSANSMGDSISRLPGVGGAYDSLGNGLDKAAEDLENAISALTCSGGCIPMPINFAFLAPGPINMLGVPSGFDPGFAIFGWETYPPFVCTGPSCYASNGGRIYLSPTLTGKMALSTCLGPYLVGFGPVPGNCYTVILPASPLDTLCDAVDGLTNGALSNANNLTAGGSGAIGAINDGSISNTPTTAGDNYTSGFQASDSLGNYEMSVDVKANVRLPGFPSVLTEWLDMQSSEIINKLTDMPDIYLILPDPCTIFGQRINGQCDYGAPDKTEEEIKEANARKEPLEPSGLMNTLNTINSIPLFKIEPQEVIIKIPSLTPGEIDRFINDAKQWVEDEYAELDRALNIWKCGPFKETVPYPNKGVNENGEIEADEGVEQVPGYVKRTIYDEEGKPLEGGAKYEIVYGERPYMQVCDIITADMTKTIKSVEKNIEIIEGYKQIPRQILAWRNMFSKYVVQIVCYIDAIVNFFVGNIAKWLDQAYAWVDAAMAAYEMVMTWKLLFDLVIEYQASCDKCTSARFSLLELVLKLFAFVPDPPIIPFPKLPDLYMDLSQIQLGVKILWPDIQFRPEKIVLPELPRIVLPDLPTYRIEFPAIPLLPDLSFNLPELPDLPPLKLPVLPDLPPPPKIPGFPASIKATISILKKIFKILCLIKKGFIPTNESVLKTTIEHMTERGLEPLLPIDMGLALQAPEISYQYVEKIVLSVRLDLSKSFEFNQIYNIVKKTADKLNAVSTNFAATANSISDGINEAAANSADSFNQNIDEGFNDVTGQEASLIDELLADLGDQNLASEFSAFAPQLTDSMVALNVASSDLQNDKLKMEEIIADQFEDVHLIATTQTIYPDDALANRSLEDLKDFDYQSTMLALGDEFKQTKKLVGLRQDLIAFIDQNQALDKAAFGVNDLDQFATMMASAPSATGLFEKAGVSGSTMMASANHLFAQLPSLSDIVNSTGLPASLSSQPVAKGLLIYDQDKQINENILAYDEELSLPSNLAFIDKDNDGDEDLLYSLGSNVYLKENYSANASLGKPYEKKPLVYELDNFIPAHWSPFQLNSNFNGNSLVEVSWQASDWARDGGYELALTAKDPDMRAWELSSGNLKNSSQQLKRYIYLNQSPTISQEKAETSESDGNDYQFPPLKTHFLKAMEVQGQVIFDGPSMTKLVANNNRLTIKGNNQLFASKDSRLAVWVDGEQKNDLFMKANDLMEFPSSFGENLEIMLVSGDVTEIDLNQKTTEQKLLPGYMMELETDYLSVDEGTALFALPESSYVRLGAEETLNVQEIADTDNPSADLSLENGFYYANVRSFSNGGFRSLPSETVVLSPNICSDRQEPLPVVDNEMEVAIFTTLELDASKSFDSGGKIVSYYIDTDPEKDQDNDGDPKNDKNLGHDLDANSDSDGNGVTYDDLDDPLFKLGPYKDLDDRKVVLNIVDQSGNVGQQEILIHVFVPAIVVDESSAVLSIGESGLGSRVKGFLEPVVAKMPIALIRDRDGVRDLIKTDAADTNNKYFTDNAGEFSVDDLDLNDRILIKDRDGNVIAEINPESGQIVLIDLNYRLKALPAEEPLLPTRVVVENFQGQVVATLFVVSDGVADVVVDEATVDYTLDLVQTFEGVHIKPVREIEGIEMKALDDESKPGSVVIVNNEGKRFALLDKFGNFYSYSNNIKLALADDAKLRDPLVFKVNYSQAGSEAVEIGEFHINYTPENLLTILDAEKYAALVGNNENKGEKYDSDGDQIPDQWEQQYGFDHLDASDALNDPDGDGLSNLDEYLAGTDPLKADSDSDGYDDKFEKIFGRDPLQAVQSPFVDVEPDNEFFKSIMNLYQRGILDAIPAGNRLKFGWQEPIERAEFAQVMLDTFCIVPRPAAYASPGVFTDIPFREEGNPWYFAPTKEAYFQGFITGYRGLIDTQTGRTPFVPEATITKAEAVKIILEALEREQLISLDKVPLTEPYYTAYMQVAQDLEPYLIGEDKPKSTILLYPEEALEPEKEISRGEFMMLADRVLLNFDCSSIDTDGDGMPDFWEQQNGLDYLDPSDADEDPDGDGLKNLDEFKFGTDPQAADTDGGGVWDGEEVMERQSNPLDAADDWGDLDGDGLTDNDEKEKYKTDYTNPDTDGGGVSDGDEVLLNGTNPLSGYDDLDSDGDGLGDREEQELYGTEYLNPDTDGGGVQDGAEVLRKTDPLNGDDDLIDPKSDLAEGAYVIPQACNACPCPSTIEHTADLLPGDKIMAVISNSLNSIIYSESNIVEIEEVN